MTSFFGGDGSSRWAVQKPSHIMERYSERRRKQQLDRESLIQAGISPNPRYFPFTDRGKKLAEALAADITKQSGVPMEVVETMFL